MDPCGETKPKRKKQINDEQIALIKSNLLNPTEVTFCDLTDDEDGVSHDSSNQRKRLTSTGETDSIASSTKKYTMPDGGYGWVVVFASFCVSMVIDGISFSFGLLYTELLAYFQESESKTSWIGSIFLSLPLLSGPIMSNLVDTYGCRKMTMIGGLLAGTGFVLAAFSNSIEMLYLTYGVISGLGLGIAYVTAVVSIAFWFDKKRSFAVGIGASGTGLGTVFYAPFTKYLLATYGWRGTTLIIAGTLYNLCVFGALMRDPDWLIEENRLESRSQSIQTVSNASVHVDDIKKLINSGVNREDVLDSLVTNVNTEANQQITAPDEGKKKFQSEYHLPTYINTSQLELPKGIMNNSHSSRSLRNDKKIIESCPTSPLKSMMAGCKQLTVKLASSESLNPSEKESWYETARGSTDSGLSEDFHRRLSLDDSLFKSQYDVKLSDQKLRGHSLDAIDEMEGYDNSVIVPLSPNRDAKLIKNGQPRNRHHKQQIQSHYFRNVVIHRNSINYRNAMLNTHRYRFKASSCPNIFRNSMTTIAREEQEVRHFGRGGYGDGMNMLLSLKTKSKIDLFGKS